jgi:hypothetical protein
LILQFLLPSPIAYFRVSKLVIENGIVAFVMNCFVCWKVWNLGILEKEMHVAFFTYKMQFSPISQVSWDMALVIMLLLSHVFQVTFILNFVLLSWLGLKRVYTCVSLWSMDTGHWHVDTANNLKKKDIIPCNYKCRCVSDTGHA